MAEWPSGTVTFLFTDLEGSTQRWQQYPAAMGPALARHDRLLRDAISAHGGVVFKTVGDAVCAAFATAPAAVNAALTAQRALYSEPWGSTGPLRARMALHTGQAEAHEGDYLGGPLNRVARLLGIGHGGQILLSGPTADIVHDYLPPGVTLRELGTHNLKDVHRPEHVYQVVAPDLPSDFAPLSTTTPAPHWTDSRPEPPVAAAGRSVRRPAAIAIAAVLAVALAGALAARWIGGDDDDHGSPTAAFTGAGAPASPPAPPPTATTTVAAVPSTVAVEPTGAVVAIPPTLSPSSASAASPAGPEDAAASGEGQVVYSVYAGQAGAGHVYRVAATAGAVPEDVSAALDSRFPKASDAWIAISPDGGWLLLGTERLDPECVGWPCLAVVRSDLSSAEVVRIAGKVAHPGGSGAIAGDFVVFPAAGGPHEVDLWATRREGNGWSELHLLTGDSPYAYHAEPALAKDGMRVAFECGDRPYGEAGTALCEVGTDGTGFRVALTPANAPAGLPATGALRHPSYTPDGAIVFEATWDGRIWRIPAGAASAEPVGPRFDLDGVPCVLPDGRVASLWLGRPGNPGLHELKVMTPDGAAYAMLVAGIDIEELGCGD